uniref:LIM zinc-binding domain-containing protein n=1 Tax=Romanomermis culicivorax TaxID=13658 RepID=A0A915IWP0_ROMCU
MLAAATSAESHRHQRQHHHHPKQQQHQSFDVMMIKCNQSPSSSSSPISISSSSSMNNGSLTASSSSGVNGNNNVNMDILNPNLYGLNNLTTTTPTTTTTTPNNLTRFLAAPPPQNVNLNMVGGNQQNLQYFRNFAENSNNKMSPMECSPMVGQAASGAKFCAGCAGKILDRYLLLVADRYWHETCLRCSHCAKILNDQKSLFVKNDRIYCRDDYIRLFRPNLLCSVCQNVIQPAEQMMKVYANLYHLDCFACQECTHRFCIGEKYYFDRRINKILCENDFEERKVFSSFSAGDLNRIKRKISKDIV